MRKSYFSKRGVTATSYGLIVGLIAIIALAAITTIGSNVDSLFTDVSDSLHDVTEGTADAAPSAPATPTPTPLFGFTSHTFTDCGAGGMNGPVIGMCTSAYSTSWDEDTGNFSMPHQGYQMFTVPQTGTYTIEVAGAGNNGEAYNGARISADFDLTLGDQLLILVGQQGNGFRSGSGGSFVAVGTDYTTATPLIVAGGAGGHYTTAPNPERRNATFTDDAYYSLDSTTPSGFSGPTGTNGQGGGAHDGGGGGGFFSSGTCVGCTSTTGAGFQQGGVGGTWSSNTYQGGFGGGGSYHTGFNGGGGGGGYSGGRGGGSSSYHGWGGGSYTAPSAVNRQDLGIDSEDDGFVTITFN